MLSVENARQQMLDTIPVLPSERRGILNCAGYVLAEELRAAENIPPFDNSAMDGYAVRAADVKDASKENPVVLSVVETIAAGYAPTEQVATGQVARIMTGAMMPEANKKVRLSKFLKALGSLKTSVSRVRASRKVHW